MRELWERLLIVGVGEVDDGAFPSLAVGATEVLFEELWEQALEHSEEDARVLVAQTFEREGAAFHKAWLKRAEHASLRTRTSTEE